MHDVYNVVFLEESMLALAQDSEAADPRAAQARTAGAPRKRGPRAGQEPASSNKDRSSGKSRGASGCNDVDHDESQSSRALDPKL